MKVANTMEVRLQNAINIMKAIESHSEITIADIALSQNLSIPTISNIVNIVKASNMIIGTGTGESSGGRRPLQLSINAQYQNYIGVSIAKHTVYVVLINFAGKILQERQCYIDFESTEKYWKEIAKLIDEFKENSEVECRVGLAFPGFIDYYKNLIVETDSLGVSNISISEVQTYLGEEVAIGDSCRLAGVAQLFGKTEYEDSFFILLSRRISGVLIHSEEILDLKESSMNIGAMVIDSNIQTSRCGKPGTFLDLCSASNIIDTLKEQGRMMTYEEFFSFVENGEKELVELWNNYLHYLAIALHNAHSMLGVDIVIGGEMSRYVEKYKKELTALLNEKLTESETGYEIRFSEHEQYDDAFGAALAARIEHIIKTLPEILKK